MPAPRDPAAQSPAVLQPVLGGIVTAVVGFAGAFAVVLAGLRAVGASEAQAASGLLALCLAQAVGAIVLSVRTRMPISLAWSTPGAALLISAGGVAGGFPAAVGAFLTCGVALALVGLWRPLGRAIAAIPGSIASAMLAGVLLTVCLAPARAAADTPLSAAPVILTWAILAVFARRWAVPGALLAAVAVIAVDGGPVDAPLVPPVELVAPVFGVEALIGIALPLFLVTMASQNVPGMAVLASFGYRPELRPILLVTGAGTVAAAPFGGHAINLAAITAALAAGPEAGPDPGRRWIASTTAGVVYLGLAVAAGLATAVALAAPPLIIETVAALALLGALAGALAVAAADGDRREAAIVTFVVSASQISPLGISSPFWGLVAGLALLGLARRRRGSLAPMPSQLVHTCVRVRDPEASVRFYAALGFERRGQLNFDSAYNVYLGLPGGGDTLELTVNAGREEPYDLGEGYNHVAVAVDDLDTTLARLDAIGVAPEKPPYRPGGRDDLPRIAFVADPDGYRVELIDGGRFETPQDPPHPSAA